MKKTLLLITYSVSLFMVLLFIGINVTLSYHENKVMKILTYAKDTAHTVDKSVDKAKKIVDKAEKTVKKIKKLTKQVKGMQKDAKELTKEVKGLSKTAEKISKHDITVKVDSQTLEKADEINKTANRLFSDKRFDQLILKLDQYKEGLLEEAKTEGNKYVTQTVQKTAQQAGDAAGKSFGESASKEVGKNPFELKVTTESEGNEPNDGEQKEKCDTSEINLDKIKKCLQ